MGCQLAQFHFTVKYRPGKSNPADALSRLPPDFHPEASSSPMPPEVAVAQELACEHQSIATAPPVTSLPADTPAKAPEGCPPVSPSLSSARLRECQLKQAAAKRARYADKGAADHALQVGDHVYLRNRALGRLKIQDFWRPELHRVTARPFDNVYMTQPLAGGPERAVNRKDIMPATAPFVVDAAGQQSPSLRPDVTDSESGSDDELCVLTPQTLAPVAVAVPAVTPVVQRPPVPLPRRSRRLAEKNIIQQ